MNIDARFHLRDVVFGVSVLKNQGKGNRVGSKALAR